MKDVCIEDKLIFSYLESQQSIEAGIKKRSIVKDLWIK